MNKIVYGTFAAVQSKCKVALEVSPFCRILAEEATLLHQSHDGTSVVAGE